MFSLNSENEKVYNLLSVKEIKELNLNMYEIEHKKTKAKVILCDCDDENRVFCIGFKTLVSNSKGTPHILEHSVLCGSKKYNVKDPFMELAKGSMNTFLNAMTFPDKTCYPIASINLKDFKNLMDVYLDAVFFPNAIKNDLSFKQEGWHYEYNDRNELTINGVVYNEMKGVNSDPEQLMDDKIFQNLYKGTDYAYDYGGNPKEIFDLSFDEFKEFHKKYYSPSNSITYLYGKLDFNERLAYIDKEYFSKFDYIDVKIDFKLRKDFKKKEENIEYYNFDSDDAKGKSYIAYSFDLGTKKSNLTRIALNILDHILFSSDSAILRDKLLSLGFGESIEIRNEPSFKSSYFSIIAQNIDENRKDEFIATIDDFFKNAFSYITKEQIDAALNITYFEYADDDTNRTSKGIELFMDSLDSYLYTDNYSEFIKYENDFNTLRKVDFDDKNNIYRELIKNCFVDNNRTNITILRPKKNYLLEKETEIRNKIAEKTKNFDEKDFNNIKYEIEELKKYQTKTNTKEELATIPHLELSDLEPERKYFDYTIKDFNGHKVLITNDNNKNIVYLKLYFDMNNMSDTEIYMSKVISELLFSLDLKNERIIDYNIRKDLNTGGMSSTISIFESDANLNLNTRVEIDKLDIAINLIYDLIKNTIFDDKNKIENIIRETKTKAYLDMLSHGHTASKIRALSNSVYSNRIMDMADSCGIAFNLFIKKLCDIYNDNFSLIKECLETLFSKLLSNLKLVAISINPTYNDKASNFIDNIILKIKELQNINPYDDNSAKKLAECFDKLSNKLDVASFKRKSKKEAILTSNDINFVSMASNYDKNLYSGRCDFLRVLFNYEYLWNNIRILGGAYGCMGQVSNIGHFYFSSYRDPNVCSTNKTFLNVYKYLKDIELDDETILKYIIGTFSGYDTPCGTSGKFNLAIGSYFSKTTNEELNNRRKDVLNLKLSDIKDLCNVFKDFEKNCEMCALISKTSLEEAKKEYDDIWTI